jgi:hypothetical protein
MLAAVAVVALATLTVPGPAGAQAQGVARGAAMSSSASCSQGDIEIEYSGSAVERQVTTFSAADGRVLHQYDVEAYAPNHDGTEYILSQTRQPPPAGTLVAVRVTIGSSPPGPGTAEFIVAYRCDAEPNDAGGSNQIVYVCAGAVGTCPISAQEISLAATPVVATPTFTG